MSANPKDPDRYTLEDWRAVCPDVRQMRRWQWQVESLCDHCGLRLRVSLAVIILVKGPRFSLWGAATPCRRIGCRGDTSFRGRPPGSYGLIDLVAARRIEPAPANAAKGRDYGRPRSLR